jgi:DNA-directed RNA polymerase subunit M/transcription elongation factor TFIIS
MHFCEKCDNMYYIKVNGDDDVGESANSLIYYCRKCGHENKDLTSNNICVSKMYIKRSEQQFNHSINSYTKNDPTLPRSTTIKCPSCNSSNINSSSSSTSSSSSKSEDVNPEVIYIRYDDTHMKYVYLCTKCETTWKTSDKK